MNLDQILSVGCDISVTVAIKLIPKTGPRSIADTTVEARIPSCVQHVNAWPDGESTALPTAVGGLEKQDRVKFTTIAQAARPASSGPRPNPSKPPAPVAHLQKMRDRQGVKGADRQPRSYPDSGGIVV